MTLTPEEEKLRGAAVERLLADEHVQAAFEDLERRYFRQFIDSTDSRDRDELHARTKALQELQDELRAIVSSGKHAADQLERRAR